MKALPTQHAASLSDLSVRQMTDKRQVRQVNPRVACRGAGSLSDLTSVFSRGPRCGMRVKRGKVKNSEDAGADVPWGEARIIVN